MDDERARFPGAPHCRYAPQVLTTRLPHFRIIFVVCLPWMARRYSAGAATAGPPGPYSRLGPACSVG